MQHKPGNKAALFQDFYFISARAVSGQNISQDCWPLCLFTYKARLMIPGWWMNEILGEDRMLEKWILI